MSADLRSPASTWTRRVPGSTILVFLLLSGGLWIACLLAWEVSQPEFVVGFLAASAFVPLVWLVVRLQTRPLWALEVVGEVDSIGDALRRGLGTGVAIEIGSADADREGLFRRCDTLLHIDGPACLVGVERSVASSRTTVLLLPRSRDGRAVGALRTRIASLVGVA